MPVSLSSLTIIFKIATAAASEGTPLPQRYQRRRIAAVPVAVTTFRTAIVGWLPLAADYVESRCATIALVSFCGFISGEMRHRTLYGSKPYSSVAVLFYSIYNRFPVSFQWPVNRCYIYSWFKPVYYIENEDTRLLCGKCKVALATVATLPLKVCPR